MGLDSAVPQSFHPMRGGVGCRILRCDCLTGQDTKHRPDDTMTKPCRTASFRDFAVARIALPKRPPCADRCTEKAPSFAN